MTSLEMMREIRNCTEKWGKRPCKLIVPQSVVNAWIAESPVSSRYRYLPDSSRYGAFDGIPLEIVPDYIDSTITIVGGELE